MPTAKPLRVTVTIEPAEVPWSDILDAVTVEPDTDMTDAPWDNCDGWEHTAEPLRYYDAEHCEARQNSTRYVNRATRDGGDVWLTLDLDKAGLPDWRYFHAKGASKQVAHELAAMQVRSAYKQLADWYSNGWEYWYVSAELKGCHAGCGGVDDYQYATGEMTEEIAHELAADLERNGYLVTDKPAPVPYRPQFANYQHSKRVHSFDVDCRR